MHLVTKLQFDKNKKATNLHGINRLYRPGAGRKPATFNWHFTPKWIVKIVVGQVLPKTINIEQRVTASDSRRSCYV
jgi:hypothetical protein